MSVEQYSNEVTIVTVAEEPSDITVWLRETTIMELSPEG
jgi:hypothetical protein